jgi:hypothetical protein
MHGMENVKKKSKHTFYVQQLFSKNHAIHDTMWKDKVQPDKPYIKI